MSLFVFHKTFKIWSDCWLLLLPPGVLLIVTFVVTDTLLWLLFSASLFSALLCSISALRDFLGGDEDVPGPGADTDPDPVADEEEAPWIELTNLRHCSCLAASSCLLFDLDRIWAPRLFGKLVNISLRGFRSFSIMKLKLATQSCILCTFVSRVWDEQLLHKVVHLSQPTIDNTVTVWFTWLWENKENRNEMAKLLILMKVTFSNYWIVLR